ncbi:glycosyltransferase family 2 protein [Flavobacterium soli]|uniref:glycosyltransferase family 2 protein n=1 Tax=Flavobacterium soli TaxID=344881 RepID=UPI0003F7841D|nr:glycosyltransferase [Flavobacterium soli]
MEFSLIICTYKRAQPLLRLLESVALQTVYPFEILIIDGSPDHDTYLMLSQHTFRNIKYHKVEPKDRGLTKQRNFGISKVDGKAAIVCFLDDDTVLDAHYFQEILATYAKYPESLGVGGYITNEVQWTFVGEKFVPKIEEFYFDGYIRKEGSRFVVRKKLGLDSDVPPGYSSEFSHGRSIGFLPPSGKIYATQQLMGGVASFKKEVFETLQFSTYFEGYGLYEDADFTLRLSNLGKLFVNTNAKLAHYHDASGRPNQYEYGKMVVRNGYYVWRVKYPKPSFISKTKWHSITLLLTLIRMTNVLDRSSVRRKEAFTEALGRIVGWWSLFFSNPLKNT